VADSASDSALCEWMVGRWRVLEGLRNTSETQRGVGSVRDWTGVWASVPSLPTPAQCEGAEADHRENLTEVAGSLCACCSLLFPILALGAGIPTMIGNGLIHFQKQLTLFSDNRLWRGRWAAS